MALKKRLQTLDGLDEAIRSLYKQAGDGFELDVEGGLSDGSESVATLERTVKSLRKERDEAVAKQKAAETSAEDAAKKLEALEASGRQSDEKVSAMLAKWQEDTKAKVESAVKEAELKYAPLAQKVERYELDGALQAAFLANGGSKKHLARAVALAKLEGWTLADGKPVKRDEAGELSTVTVEDYFKVSFREAVPEFYEGSKASGSDARGADRGAAAKGGASGSVFKWSSEDRRAFIEANGADAYQKLLDESLVAGPPPKE